MGPGNLNDFNLHLPPTIMDLALIWEREQELRLQTGKSVGQRKEQHLAKCEAIGPLYFRSADRSNTSSSASTLGPASTSASYAELYCQRMERYFLGFPQSAQLLFKQKLAFLTDAALKSEGELSAGGSGDEKMDSICKNGCRDETNMSSVGSHNQNDDHGGSPGDNSFAGADAAKNGNVSTNMNVDNCNENSTSDGEHKESKNAGAEDKNGELAMDSDNKYIVQQNGNYTVSSHVLSLLLNSTLPTTSAGTASTNAAVESVGEIIEYLRSHRTSYQRAPSKVEVATVQKAPGCSSAMSECALKKKEGLNYPDADAITASQARQLLEHTKKKQKVSNSDKSDNIGSHCSYSDVESDVQFQNELISLLARFPASA